MTTHIDLDAFNREQYGEGEIIVLFGKEWTLASDMSFALGMALTSDKELSQEEEKEIFREIFNPTSQADELFKLGLGVRNFKNITRIAIAAANGIPADVTLASIAKEREDAVKLATEDSEPPKD